MGPWDVSHGPLDQRQTLVALREFLVDIHPLKNIFNVESFANKAQQKTKISIDTLSCSDSGMSLSPALCHMFKHASFKLWMLQDYARLVKARKQN